MARLVNVGKKQQDLDDKQSSRLMGGLNWLENREPDTSENRETWGLIAKELRRRGFIIHDPRTKPVSTGAFVAARYACNKRHKNYPGSAICHLKAGHAGDHCGTRGDGRADAWDNK